MDPKFKRGKYDEDGTPSNENLESLGKQIETELMNHIQRCKDFTKTSEDHTQKINLLSNQYQNFMKAREEKIGAEVKRIEEFKWKAESFGKQSDIIKFEIEGKTFTCSRNIFKNLPVCFFTTLLSEEPTGTDGSYFINRNCALFEVILEFLNGADISKKLQAMDLDVLEEEARFYGVEEEMKKIVERERKNRWTIAPTLNGKLSDGGLSLCKIGEFGERACISVGTQGWSEGVHQFSIQYTGEGAHLGVGVSAGGIHQTDLRKNINLFYALDCGNGRAIGVGGLSRVVVENVGKNGFAPGTKVSIKLDLNKRFVTFAINDVWLDPPFTNINKSIYFPYFFLGRMDKTVTVVEK